VAFNSSARPQEARAASTQGRAHTMNRSYRIPGVILSLCSSILALGGIFYALFSWHGPVSLLFSIVVGLFGTRMFVLWLGATRPTTKKLVTEGKPWMRSITAGDAQQLPLIQPGLPQALYPHAISSPASTTTAPAPQAPYSGDYALQTTFPGIYDENPQVATAIAMNVPIDKDPLFQLDEPVPGTQCFILPREGKLMSECQDRFALNSKRSRYAVADGKAGSFVPAPWARILCKNFVERSGDFASEEEFTGWLVACSQQWHRWMVQRWVPTMNVLRARSGDKPGDWSNDIRQGAEAALIGCSIVPGSPVRKTTPAIRVFAIGDSEFFLFRPHPANGWTLMKCFPYIASHQSGTHPYTVTTSVREDMLKGAWTHHQKISINALTGDRIILATGTIARWLLRQIEQNTGHWVPFLNITDPEVFAQYLRQEQQAGRIEDEDLTMLSIAVQ
jgi:hypothetical protein